MRAPHLKYGNECFWLNLGTPSDHFRDQGRRTVCPRGMATGLGGEAGNLPNLGQVGRLVESLKARWPLCRPSQEYRPSEAALPSPGPEVGGTPWRCTLPTVCYQLDLAMATTQRMHPVGFKQSTAAWNRSPSPATKQASISPCPLTAFGHTAVCDWQSSTWTPEAVSPPSAGGGAVVLGLVPLTLLLPVAGDGLSQCCRQHRGLHADRDVCCRLCGKGCI